MLLQDRMLTISSVFLWQHSHSSSKLQALFALNISLSFDSSELQQCSASEGVVYFNGEQLVQKQKVVRLDRSAIMLLHSKSNYSHL